MKKGYKILIGLAIVGAIYFTYTKIKKSKKGFFFSGGLGENVLISPNDDIYFSEMLMDGSIPLGEYLSNGNNMSFPLYNTGSPYSAYDNVAKLQTYLVFANADIGLVIDGMYGDETEAAVMQEVSGLENYGYGAADYDYSEITQQYYNEVVLPELEYFISNQLQT